LRFAAIARYYLVSRARAGHVAALAARLHGLPITEKDEHRNGGLLVPSLPVCACQGLRWKIRLSRAD
jgi:hypothetical protein